MIRNYSIIPIEEKQQMKPTGKTLDIKKALNALFWFCVGSLLGLLLFTSFIYIVFQKRYESKIFPGVSVKGIDFGEKTKEEVKSYFQERNQSIESKQFTFLFEDTIATASAKDLALGFDSSLIATQTYSIGRSGNLLSDIRLVLHAYLYGLELPPTYHFSDKALEDILTPFAKAYYKKPVNAQFTIENGRVTTFQASENGRSLDTLTVKKNLHESIPQVFLIKNKSSYSFPIKAIVLEPSITTEKVNSYGIKELIATGTSVFKGSIPGRIHNVVLGASRINGALIKPGEVFSFNKTIGDISAFTGYKQAYVIQNGKTVLGDGGGICQVSTTLFRAVLNAGLPIVERNAHAYRVGYYEQDAPPGLDATVFSPSVDFRFKNDTENYILIQTQADPDNATLTFLLYGTKDNREVTLTKPVISSSVKPPDPITQDDPTLPKGEIKHVEHQAWGAKVTFSREVKKEGKVILADSFPSVYRAWGDVFLRGTKE